MTSLHSDMKEETHWFLQQDSSSGRVHIVRLFAMLKTEMDFAAALRCRVRRQMRVGIHHWGPPPSPTGQAAAAVEVGDTLMIILCRHGEAEEGTGDIVLGNMDADSSLLEKLEFNDGLEGTKIPQEHFSTTVDVHLASLPTPMEAAELFCLTNKYSIHAHAPTTPDSPITAQLCYYAACITAALRWAAPGPVPVEVWTHADRLREMQEVEKRGAAIATEFFRGKGTGVHVGRGQGGGGQWGLGHGSCIHGLGWGAQRWRAAVPYADVLQLGSQGCQLSATPFSPNWSFDGVKLRQSPHGKLDILTLVEHNSALVPTIQCLSPPSASRGQETSAHWQNNDY
ncbi:hypothetical protein B0H17DRAFT_1151892 [Mycena rosella]|uniref:Uncharacterized protein n=1 Tax=Mycena rosella TaxID=1033263 RepID=A0AAD7BHJ0_MYCRO|nr:hypothetical protein B0H17DRAFT_1151892 [Mycena rosella]